MNENGQQVRGLIYNDDGSLGVVLRDKSVLTLREPSLDELSDLHEMVATVDDGVPRVPILGRESSIEEVQEATRVGDARARLIYGRDRPYATAFKQIVDTLAEAPLDEDQMVAWMANPAACRNVLTWFTAPLGGPESSPSLPPQQ